MALMGQEDDEDAQADKVRRLRALEDMGAQNETHKAAAMSERPAIIDKFNTSGGYIWQPK